MHRELDSFVGIAVRGLDSMPQSRPRARLREGMPRVLASIVRHALTTAAIDWIAMQPQALQVLAWSRAASVKPGVVAPH